jgi:hypothetical protein
MRDTRALFAAAALAGFTLGAPAQADETFFCEDGTTVTVTSANREAMREHPCVKRWFAADEAARAAKQAEKEEDRPRQAYAGGVIRNSMLVTPAAAANPTAQGSDSGSRTRTYRVRLNTTSDKSDKTAKEPQKKRLPVRLRRGRR